MAPAANTNRLPNCGKAPATSHDQHGSNPMENQSRTAGIFADSKPTASTTTTTQPEHDAAAEIEKHLRASGSGGMELLSAFRNASKHPPVTPNSLADLDIPQFMNNPKLRHDVNFDRELHFSPSLGGARCEQKSKSAEDYWKAVEAELHMLFLSQTARAQPDGTVSPCYWESVMRESRKRLPSVFEVVRDILTTLVPDQDQAKITERLDVDLLIQQIDNGVCDLVNLANWLGKVLKNHCAPMRDGLVDRMRKAITKGAQQADQKLMVSGLQQLLNLLEAMKLDVANHQIRYMHPLLIYDTVNFLKRYHNHRIGLGKLNPEVSRLWLEQEYNTLSAIEGTPMSYLDTLTHALLRDLLFCSSTTSLTSTFYLDLDRLHAIRVDMRNMVCHLVCGKILVDLLDPAVPVFERRKALLILNDSLTAIAGPQGFSMDCLGNFAAEIVRVVLMREGCARLYDAELDIQVEYRLRKDLDPKSSVFCDYARDLLHRFLPKTKECVNAHRRMPAIELQEALVPPIPVAPTHSFGMGAVCEPVPVSRSTDPDMDLIRRFSHVVVLHWQVWADLVYLVKPEPEYGLSSLPPSIEPEPVTRAIFDPGHKFIPEAITTDSEGNGMPTPAAPHSPEVDDLDNDQASSL